MHKWFLNTAQHILCLTALLFFLSACSGNPTAAPQAVEETPTISATETVAFFPPTTQITETLPPPTLTVPNPIPSLTDLPPIVLEQPTAVFTAETVTNMNGRRILPAEIQIKGPGPGSKVVSPIVLETNFYPGDDGQVLVQLFGEDGRLIAEKLMTVVTPSTGWILQTVKIPFEVSTAGEAALLAVSTRDGFGRRIAQSSVPLLLMQIGKNDLKAPGFARESFVLDTPVYDFVARNGMLHIQGFVHPSGDGQIVGELISRSGGILGSTAVDISIDTTNSDYIPFSMDIPYSVAERTGVRLILRQTHERLPGVDVSLKSLIIYLDP